MVKKYGFAAPVCNVDWDDKDANVTCVELGFTGGVAKLAYSYSPAPILLGYFDCKGTEKTLESCPHVGVDQDVGCSRPDGLTYSARVQVAGVLCYKHQGT